MRAKHTIINFKLTVKGEEVTVNKLRPTYLGYEVFINGYSSCIFFHTNTITMAQFGKSFTVNKDYRFN